MKLSIVIPVYNEAKTIRTILERVSRASLPQGISKEIIIVNDHSTDGTKDILEELEDLYDLKVIHHEQNLGKGAALRHGLTAVSGDFAIIQDADLEYDPHDYDSIIRPLVYGKSDIVYGSRYLGKSMREMLSVNYVANRVLTSVSNLFTGFSLTDMETCYKAYSNAAIKKIAPALCSDRFDIEPELTAAAASKGFSIVEVPISYAARAVHEGKKIKWHDGFPGLWAIIRYGYKTFFRVQKMKILFWLSMAILMAIFFAYVGPKMLGDSPTYVESISVMNGHEPAADFIPNRILTTFGALEAIRALTFVTGSLDISWSILNFILYISSVGVFYKLMAGLFRSERAALLGGLFLAANYGFFNFGLNLLMDIGGWAFYIFSLYYLFSYSRSKKSKHLMLSAAMVGLGGLFKEYAFLGAVAIAVYVICESYHSWNDLAKKAVKTASLALIPTAMVFVYVYFRFGYTYADWFGTNHEHYVYNSRILEYIKASGSLFNFLAFPVIGGAWLWLRRKIVLDDRAQVFVIAAIVSFLPIFFWPAITQRILTAAVPAGIIIAGFAFKRTESRWVVWLPVLAVYIIASFFMDSYILNAVNLPF